MSKILALIAHVILIIWLFVEISTPEKPLTTLNAIIIALLIITVSRSED